MVGSVGSESDSPASGHAVARPRCPAGQVPGTLIRHASSPAALPLRVPMVLCAFVRAAVGAPGPSSRPRSPLGPAGVAAVGLPSVAAAVEVEVGTAPAAGDLVEFRRSPARAVPELPGRWDALCQRSVSVRRRRAHSRLRHHRLLRRHPRRGSLVSPVVAVDDASSPAPVRYTPRRLRGRARRRPPRGAGAVSPLGLPSRGPSGPSRCPRGSAPLRDHLPRPTGRPLCAALLASLQNTAQHRPLRHTSRIGRLMATVGRRDPTSRSPSSHQPGSRPASRCRCRRPESRSR